MAGSADLYQVSLKVILRNTRNEVLVASALPTATLAGSHDLPGGRITVDEFGTPIDEIIARELREEVGDIKYELTPTPVAVGRHIIPAAHTAAKTRDVHVLQLFYVARYTGGVIRTSDEHADLRWLDLATVDLDRAFRSGILEGVRTYYEMARAGSDSTTSS